MMRPIGPFAYRIILVMCIVLIITGICMPVNAGLSGTILLSLPCRVTNPSVSHCHCLLPVLQEKHPLMHLTDEQIDEMQREINAAPRFTAPERFTQGLSAGSVNLLSYLPYIPSQRDQGWCGNCWVWASTGALEIDHNVDYGVRDRLSIQYFNSKYNKARSGNACSGGWPYTFAKLVHYR